MPTARLSGADINYEIVGKEGPMVALVAGGRWALSDLAGLGRAIAGHEYRVLLHDRRNRGRSSLDFDSLEPEEDVWADDLAELLDHLDETPAIIGGRSRGARVTLRFALRHKADASALLLWGISGGPLAVRYLDGLYFLSILRAARTGGTPAVCATDLHAVLLRDDPSKREQLLALDPVTFIAATERHRAEFMTSATCGVLGFNDDELRAVETPTLNVPYEHRLHPNESLRHAERTIPNSHLVDFAPERRVGHPRHGSVALDAKDKLVVAQLLAQFIQDLDSQGRKRLDRTRLRERLATMTGRHR